MNGLTHAADPGEMVMLAMGVVALGSCLGTLGHPAQAARLPRQTRIIVAILAPVVLGLQGRLVNGLSRPVRPRPSIRIAPEAGMALLWCSDNLSAAWLFDEGGAAQPYEPAVRALVSKFDKRL